MTDNSEGMTAKAERYRAKAEEVRTSAEGERLRHHRRRKLAYADQLDKLAASLDAQATRRHADLE
ncbi:hypothetical protein [Salinarimonas soli]|uniref:Uncharacterized protein n=1 Tax=Salinarimonas soli TaxID=1638099 RepID=A0A5B2VCB0_9HYPH|nr:hypothetical protein [Salinarimonas soli]KAA2235939.1 hypothetical protein F0L46_17395 [Salinarimonas soli]